MGSIIVFMLLTAFAAVMLTLYGFKMVSPDHPIYVFFVIVMVGSLISVGMIFILTLLHFLFGRGR